MESVIKLPSAKLRRPPLPMGGDESMPKLPARDLEIGMLVFQCPKTHLNVESGIDTDSTVQRAGVL